MRTSASGDAACPTRPALNRVVSPTRLGRFDERAAVAVKSLRAESVGFIMAAPRNRRPVGRRATIEARPLAF